jgi:hypothetical protein
MPNFSAAPAGWERETPRYKVIHETHPSQNSRFRLEPPHAYASDGSYQYGDRVLRPGEIIETRAWPHPSFHPLNRSAEKVLAFFQSAPKSRLPISPWRGDRIVLDTGLEGPTQPKFKIGVTA